MTLRTLGVAGITLLSTFAGISGVAVDFTASHIYNPVWPPHAQFHGYLSIARTVLIMTAAILLAWGPVRRGDRAAWIVLAVLLLGWVAIWLLAPIVVPGTGDRATYVFAAVLAPLYLVSIWLVRPPPDVSRLLGEDVMR
ncbi:MAG: hypothetical protein DMD92_21565 [Candidatus Rokuibacteriota bacterium]|nr:MAG: hypothetical protein DMD92_21565 [Candidatus Rokubacteria bacterium]